MVKLTEALVLARSRATDLENVRKFNCWGSDLNDIKIIRRMPNVQVLSLSVNKISTLADFAHCLNLEELYIRKNDISDLNEICFLKQLPKLRILWLSDNPCSEQDAYRMTVLKNLPNLQKLDNSAVQEEEVNSAIEQGHDLVTPMAPCESLDLRQIHNPTQEPGNIQNIVSASLPAMSVFTEAQARVNGAVGGAGDHNNGPVVESTNKEDTASSTEKDVDTTEDQETLSWAETNKIRVQLGLKPLPVEKVTPMKPRSSCHSAKTRNANLLQATLHLVKELDADSLEVVADAVRNRLEVL